MHLQLLENILAYHHSSHWPLHSLFLFPEISSLLFWSKSHSSVKSDWIPNFLSNKIFTLDDGGDFQRILELLKGTWDHMGTYLHYIAKEIETEERSGSLGRSGKSHNGPWLELGLPPWSWADSGHGLSTASYGYSLPKPPWPVTWKPCLWPAMEWSIGTDHNRPVKLPEIFAWSVRK